MIQHHYHRLIHPKEKDLQQHGADSAPLNCYRRILCSAQANQAKAEIMHAGQFLGSIAGAFLSGVHPKKPTFMLVHAVTYTV